MLTLILGGARSGKSAFAERLAGRAPDVTYIATAVVGHDEDLRTRVEAHVERRPSHWRTVEIAMAGDLVSPLLDVRGTVLVDSLGTWLAGHRDFCVDGPAVVEALRCRPGDTYVVSDEVGLGVYPSTQSGGRFRDALGSLNSMVAAACDEVLLIVAGRVAPLLSVERYDTDPHGPGPSRVDPDRPSLRGDES